MGLNKDVFSWIKMRRNFIWPAFLSSALIGTLVSFQNCSPQKLQNDSATSAQDSNQIQLGPRISLSATAANSQLRYFGFFADGMEHEGSGNYINETSVVANVHFVSADTPDGLTPKIRLAAARSSKVFIMAEGLLFDWQTVRLQQNYKANLANLRKHLVDKGLIGSVIGFYVIDEPYFKNSVASNKLTDQEVYNNLKTAAIEINKVFGSPIIISSEAFPILDQYVKTGQWLAFPEEYSWLAINCYLAFAATCDTEAKYENYVKALQSTLKGSQRVFMTLDNYYNINPDASIESKLIERTKFQVKLALKYDSPALISFLYQGASDRVGVENLPALKDYIFNLASSITGKGTHALEPEPTPLPKPNPTPNPGCANLEPRCEGADSVRRNSCGAIVESWKNAPICTSVKCEGHDSVRRDSNNKIMEIWKDAPLCNLVKCEGPDYVRRDEHNKIVEVWKNAPTCTTVKCEGHDYVRRDSNYKVMEIWANAPLCR